jgi:hypothetical protein
MLLYKLTRSFVGTPNGVSGCTNSGRAVARPYDNCRIKEHNPIFINQLGSWDFRGDHKVDCDNHDNDCHHRNCADYGPCN